MRMKSDFAELATLGKSRVVVLNSYKKTKLVPQLCDAKRERAHRLWGRLEPTGTNGVVVGDRSRDVNGIVTARGCIYPLHSPWVLILLIGPA